MSPNHLLKNTTSLRRVSRVEPSSELGKCQLMRLDTVAHDQSATNHPTSLTIVHTLSSYFPAYGFWRSDRQPFSFRDMIGSLMMKDTGAAT